MPATSQAAAGAAGAAAKRAARKEAAAATVLCIADIHPDVPQDCYGAFPRLEVVDRLPILLLRGDHAIAFAQSETHTIWRPPAPSLVLVNGDQLATIGVGATLRGPRHGEKDPLLANVLKTNAEGKVVEQMLWGNQRTPAVQQFDDMRPPIALRRPTAPDDRPPTSMPKVVVASDDVTERQNLERYDRHVESFNDHDAIALSARYADDAVLHEAMSGKTIRGKSALQEMLASRFAWSPELRLEVQSRWAAGDYIVASVLVSGRSAERPAPKGTSFSFRRLEILGMRKGRIVEHWQFSNAYRFNVALGLNEPPAPSKMASIRDAEAMTVHIGLPHPVLKQELLEQERRHSQYINLHGFSFYREPISLSEEHAEKLKEILASSDTFMRFTGEKKCGGFHPDFSIQWSDEGRRMEVQICLGCAELKIFGPGLASRHDLPNSLFWTLRELLHDYRRETPAVPD